MAANEIDRFPQLNPLGGNVSGPGANPDARRQLPSGQTIRINRVQHFDARVAEWVGDLTAVFGCPISVNAYCSGPGESGLGGHYDSHHVFVVQTHGEKLWKLGPVVVKCPSETFKPRPVFEPPVADALDLAHGQALYVPPGMWHAASTPEASIHLAVGVHPPRLGDYVAQVLAAAGERHPLLRASLPFDADGYGFAYRQPSAADFAGLLELLRMEQADMLSVS